MARVTKGNSLTSLVLQPGWTIEDDGFGLLTCSAVYKVKHGLSTGAPGTGAEALAKAPIRGEAFPKDSRLHCHRSSSSMDGNGIQTISADYVGIAAGTQTTPQVSGRFSSNQEPISTHPYFSKEPNPIGGTAANPKNGATFNEDGSFKRFADPGYDQFYGVTSYLACGFGITGHFYTSNIKTVVALKDRIGVTSGTGNFAGVSLLGDLAGLSTSWVTPREDEQLLLTGLAIESFGKLYKVSYDIMFSKDGWNLLIYSRTGQEPKKPNEKASSWDGKGTLGLGAAFNARGAATSAFGT